MGHLDGQQPLPPEDIVVSVTLKDILVTLLEARLCSLLWILVVSAAVAERQLPCGRLEFCICGSKGL